MKPPAAPQPLPENGIRTPLPSRGGLIALVERILEDLTPLLAKADLPSDLNALAAKKLAKKRPAAPLAHQLDENDEKMVEKWHDDGGLMEKHWPNNGAIPADPRQRAGKLPANLRRLPGGTSERFRLIASVTSDNSPGDAAHEAGFAAMALLGVLRSNIDRDRDDVARLAFTAGMRLAELKAILNSQPPIKAKPRSPFFTLAKTAWDNCLATRKAGNRSPQGKEIIAEMIALGIKENGDSLELAAGKNRIQKVKMRTLLNNFTRWRVYFTKWPES
jgi:hypothetical protein